MSLKKGFGGKPGYCLHGLSMNVGEARTKINVALNEQRTLLVRQATHYIFSSCTYRRMNCQGILITSLQQRQTKGVGQPVTGPTDSNGGRRRRHVGFGNHARTPAQRTSITDTGSAVATVTLGGRVTNAAQATSGKLGGSVRDTELASLSFGRKRELNVTELGSRVDSGYNRLGA